VPAPATLPSGVVTFLFTDIVGSTKRFTALGAGWADLLRHHYDIIREAVAGAGGVVVRTHGDSVFAAFSNPDDALAAAVASQRALGAAQWEEPLLVRMGLHRGLAEPTEGDYVAISVHHAARVMGAAGGGQILCSDAVVDALAGCSLPDGCATIDLGRFWLKDIDGPQRLWGITIDGGDAGVARPMAPSTVVDVPHAWSSLIGRDEDVRRVRKAVEACALTTIVAAGGCGKTRLALETAMSEWGLGPSTFVDLSTLASEDPAGPPATHAVAGAILTAIGSSLPAGAAPVEVVVERLVDRHLLVVLDNCEHVVAGAAAVCDALLRAGVRARLLATSRMPLDIDGEELVALEALAMPESDADEDLRASPAMQLLAERARQARRGQEIAMADLAALVPALRAVGALPLTIELIAARLRTLSPAELARRLERPLDVLSTTARGGALRHRSLRDVVEWSTSLLDGVAQRVLVRASVFIGRPTIADLEAVAAGGEVAEHDVLGAVDRLVTASLAAVDDEGALVVPVPVRAWAAEALASGDEAGATADRHLARLVAVAASDPNRSARLLLADLVSAMAYAGATGAIAAAARLVVDTGPALLRVGGWHGVWDVAADALDPATVPRPAPRAVVEAWVVLARIAVGRADGSSALVLAAAALDWATEIGDAELATDAHVAAAGAWAAVDEPDQARTAMAAARLAAEGAEPLTRLRVRRAQIGFLAIVPPAERAAALRDLLPELERAGDAELLLDTRTALARTLGQALNGPGPAAQEALALLDGLLDDPAAGLDVGERSHMLASRSRARWFEGMVGEARADVEAGMAAASASGDDVALAVLRNQAAALAAASGRSEEATRLYEEVLAFAIRRMPHSIDHARSMLVQVLVRRRAVDGVRRHLDATERERSAERAPRQALIFALARLWLRLHLDRRLAGPVAPPVEVAEHVGVADPAELAFVLLGHALAKDGRCRDAAWLLNRAIAHAERSTGMLMILTLDVCVLVGTEAGVDSLLMAELLAHADNGFNTRPQKRFPEEAAAIDALRDALPIVGSVEDDGPGRALEAVKAFASALGRASAEDGPGPQ